MNKKGKGKEKGCGCGGFTLIELLVVIAIIGILASVVLASLNSARAKGADAAIKANLANMRAQAALFYDNSSSYVGVCVDPVVVNAISSVNAAGGTMTCDASKDVFSMVSPLKGGGNWCVDSSGYSGTTSSSSASAAVCAR